MKNCFSIVPELKNNQIDAVNNTDMLKEQHQARAISVLNELIESDYVGRSRTTDILSEFSGRYAYGWFMHVPTFFREYLDIRLTKRRENKERVNMWTQGSRFNFKEGCLLYDTPNYQLQWSEAMRFINVGFQVKGATPATPRNAAKKLGRDQGYVEFDVLLPNSSRTRLIRSVTKVLAQDDFVRILITGPTW
jgi:hypothetical protein